jgi:tripartite-type tricarboxylate transporter receptor subunit TctC
MLSVSRMLYAATALVCAVAYASPVLAQQFPAKPVRIVIGYAPGSSTDIVGRLMAQRLGAYWKQTILVENRGGAAGNLAAEAVTKAQGDGYVLLFAQNGLAISAAALPNLPFNAEKDLMPIAPVAATPHILLVGADFPANNVQELIARAKAEPGKLTFASSGVGNSDHLCGELFNLMAGIQTIHVPYKGGAPAVQDVIPGRVTYYFAGMPLGLPLAKSGRARALGVTSKQRFPGAPEIPTLAEQGLPQYEATLWQGFFAPASITAELSERISRDVAAVLKQPETREMLSKAGVVLFEDDQANFKTFFHADIEKWKGVVKSANLKLQ